MYDNLNVFALCDDTSGMSTVNQSCHLDGAGATRKEDTGREKWKMQLAADKDMISESADAREWSLLH